MSFWFALAGCTSASQADAPVADAGLDGGQASGSLDGCSAGCPSGFRCEQSTCVGGTLDDLEWSVTSVPVTMTIRANGVAPIAGCTSGSSSLGSFTLSRDRDWNELSASRPELDLGCPAPTFSASWNLAAGDTFNVAFSSGDAPSNLPQGDFLLPTLQVAGPTDFLVDFTMLNVTGQVSSNGAPVTCQTDGAIGTVFFKNPQTRAVFHGVLQCARGAHPTYAVVVAPGSYDVFLEVQSSANTTLPTLPTLVSSLSVTKSSTLPLDAVSFPITLRFTLNGGTPAECGPNPLTSAKVTYTGTADGNVHGVSHELPCTDSTYTVRHFVGAGPLSINAGSGNGNLPAHQTTVINVVSGPNAYTFDFKAFHVTGGITVNGAPLDCSGTSSMLIRDPVKASVTSEVPVFCSSAATTFAGWLAEGDYAFVVSSYISFSTQLPFDGEWITMVRVHSALSNLDLKVSTLKVNASLLTNGVAPVEFCTGSRRKYLVGLLSSTTQLATYTFFRRYCSEPGFKQTETVFAGTFSARVFSTLSSLPAFAELPNVRIPSAGELILDFKSRHVTGAITVNGQAQPCLAGDVDGALYLDRAIYVGDLVCDNAGRLAFDLNLAPSTYSFTAVAGRVTAFPRGQRLLGAPIEVR